LDSKQVGWLGDRASSSIFWRDNLFIFLSCFFPERGLYYYLRPEKNVPNFFFTQRRFAFSLAHADPSHLWLKTPSMQERTCLPIDVTKTEKKKFQIFKIEKALTR
jgi:hypothetical protein